jgi:molecular chaperone DnaK
MGKIVGIDLGTTNSCVAVLESQSAMVIPHPEGGRTMPSIVAFTEKGERLIGAPAKRQAITNAARTICGIKRLMGRRADDPGLERLQDLTPFEIVSGPEGQAHVRVNGKTHSPTEISALILKQIKGTAQDFVGEEVTEAVITVPAYFNDPQRQATKEAGEMAGLNVRRIINEPTAAALGYGLTREAKPQILAVFDLGGGTFDITILRFDHGIFEVLATAGDTLLGGDDFDHAIVEHLTSSFEKETGHDLTTEKIARQRLREAAETAKRELSSSLSTSIHLPFVAVGEAGPLHMEHDSLRRNLVEDLVRDLLARLDGPCKTALSDARLEAREIDKVLLVGGMTRMPAVQERAEAIFGRPPSKGVDTDEVVAIGAASQGAILDGDLEEVVLLDVISHSLGIRTLRDEMSVLIPRNTTVPASATKVFRTTVDNQEQVIVHAYQGEATFVSGNTPIGELRLGDLPRQPAGRVQVDVTFTMNVDGMLEVSAREIKTGKKATVELSL